MAHPVYIVQALQLCKNALNHYENLTHRQRRRFRRFIKLVDQGHPITDKQINQILRHSQKAQLTLSHKVGGPL
jgi:hypothetical protein